MPPTVVVSPQEPKPPKPTLEERIKAAAESWKEGAYKGVETNIAYLLEQGYQNLIYKTLGLRDSWGKIEFDAYGNSDFAQDFKDKARNAASILMQQIDFSTVELSQSQISAIKNAYKSTLQDEAIKSARILAERDAISIAEQVLGIKLNGNLDDDS